MHRYRWLLLAAFAASAAIFGVAYDPAATPKPPRAAPSFNVAQRHLAVAAKGLRSGIALPRHLGAAGSFGLLRAASNADANLSRQAATLARSFTRTTAALRRAGARG